MKKLTMQEVAAIAVTIAEQLGSIDPLDRKRVLRAVDALLEPTAIKLMPTATSKESWPQPPTNQWPTPMPTHTLTVSTPTIPVGDKPPTPPTIWAGRPQGGAAK